MPSYKAPYLIGWSCFYFQLPDLEWRHVHTKIPAVVVGKMKKRERKKKRQSNVNVSRCSKEASCRLGWFIFDVADGGRQPSSTHAASSTTPTIEATRTWLGADIPVDMIWFDTYILEEKDREKKISNDGPGYPTMWHMGCLNQIGGTILPPPTSLALKRSNMFGVLSFQFLNWESNWLAEPRGGVNFVGLVWFLV